MIVLLFSILSPANFTDPFTSTLPLLTISLPEIDREYPLILPSFFTELTPSKDTFPFIAVKSALFSIVSPLKVVPPEDESVAVLTKFLSAANSIEYPFIFPLFFNDSLASKRTPPLLELIFPSLLIFLLLLIDIPLLLFKLEVLPKIKSPLADIEMEFEA